MLNMLNRVLSSDCGSDINMIAPKFKNDGGAAAAIIGAGASLLGSIGNNIIAGNLNGRNRDFQREMATRNENFTREMWHAQIGAAKQQWIDQNQWDLPANQMERLVAAGINPNNALGGMSNGSTIQGMPNNAQGQATAENSSVFSPVDLGINPQTMLAAKQLDIQEKVADADIKVKEAQANDLKESANLKNWSAQEKEQNIKNLKQEFESIGLDIKDKTLKTQYQEWYNTEMLPRLEKMTDKQYEEECQKVEQVKKDIQEKDEQIANLKEMRKTIAAQREAYLASARESISHAELMDQQKLTEEQNTRKAKYDADIAKLDEDIRKVEKIKTDVQLEYMKRYGYTLGENPSVSQIGMFMLHKTFNAVCNIFGSMYHSISADSLGPKVDGKHGRRTMNGVSRGDLEFGLDGSVYTP